MRQVKEPFFSPWNSLRLVSGIKDWVSVLFGTNRRKSRKSLVVAEKKSMTSVIFSRNSQALTGQRLSSFDEYEPISSIKSAKRDEVTRNVQPKKSRKKRQAPLPPTNVHMQFQRPHSYAGFSSNSKGVNQLETRCAAIKFKPVNSEESVNKTSQDFPKRKNKKRRAPPPPIAYEIPTIPEYAAVIKRGNRTKQSYQEPSLNFPRHHLPRTTHNNYPSKNIDEDNSEWQNDALNPFATYIGANAEPDPNYIDDSTSGSVSFSGSEDDKYEEVQHNSRASGAANGVASNCRQSNFVQYSDSGGDVCLKISIQKTETNVVTVEEMPSQRTVHYTIEEDTSTSELSDESYGDVNPERVSVRCYRNDKEELSDSSSDDREEKSKTIFEELQLRPPVKGSVKDFVQAFNMLARKSNAHPVHSKFNDKKETKNSPMILCSPSLSVKERPVATGHFAINPFLQPIAEESVAETSEHEVLYDSGGIANRHKKSSCIMDSGKIAHSMDQKCSHCSEKHKTRKASENFQARGVKKRTSPRMTTPNFEEGSKGSSASAVALSSLLKEVEISSQKKTPKNHDSDQSCFNQNKPIMVNFYVEDKSSHKGPFPLLVRPNMTLNMLKKQVEQEQGFSRHRQCWILGQSFAVSNEATLASYGVLHPGSSLLLYVMTADMRTQSLPGAARHNSSDSEDEESATHDRRRRDFHPEITKEKTAFSNSNKIPLRSKHCVLRSPAGKRKQKDSDYEELLKLESVDLVGNQDVFECPVCLTEIDPGYGAILQDCLHTFCRECLSSAIQFSDSAVVKCPFRNEEYSCECHLQEREIKSLVSPEVYERHLSRSVALAESQAQNSFHCKTPDCPGWCLYDDMVNTFLCPVCRHTNCLTCVAVHEGRNCRQYQDDLALRCDSSDEARKTREYLQSMVERGEALECPGCKVVLMKKWGCDWLRCSVCQTEVCWATRGPRWGPKGKGDTSGGCRCMVDGKRCHPKCSYCH